MSLERLFDRKLRSTVGIHPNWPFGTPLQLGDVLMKRAGRFAPVANLESDFGITNIRKMKINVGRIDLATAGVSSRTIQGGVEVTPDNIKANVKADLEIQFGRRDTFMFKTSKLSGVAIDNIAQVGFELMKNPNWRLRDFFVAYEIYNASDFTFLGSVSKTRKTVFSGTGSAVVKFLTLGLSAGLTSSGQHDAKLDVTGSKGTVGFAVARFRKNGLPIVDV